MTRMDVGLHTFVANGVAGVVGALDLLDPTDVTVVSIHVFVCLLEEVPEHLLKNLHVEGRQQGRGLVST
jgi:hypothetical protein